MIDKKLLNSAHDVSEGGLFITLIESCFNRNLGFEVDYSPLSLGDDLGIRTDAYWFGEAQSRVVVSVSKENSSDFNILLDKIGITITYLGKVTSGAIQVNGEDWDHVNYWKEKYENAIANLLAGHESEYALAAL